MPSLNLSTIPWVATHPTIVPPNLGLALYNVDVALCSLGKILGQVIHGKKIVGGENISSPHIDQF